MPQSSNEGFFFNRKIRVLPYLFTLALLVFLGVIGPIHIKTLIMEIMIWSIYALAFDLLFGYTGLFSYGQALYFGVGAYSFVFSLRHLSMNFIICLFAASFLTSVLAALLGLLIIKTKGAYFVILTIIFNVIFYLLAMDLTWLTGGEDGISIEIPPITIGKLCLSLNNPTTSYFFYLFFSLATLVFLKRIVDSPVGRVLFSIKVNEERAEYIGYNIYAYKMFSYVMSGFFCGLSGALYTSWARYASASYFSIIISGEPIVWSLIGGPGTLIGPVIGTAIIIVLLDYLSFYWKYYLILIGTLMLVVLRFSPRGIVGFLKERIEVKLDDCRGPP